MNVQTLITNSLRHAVVEVFFTMLSGEVEPGQVTVEQGSPETNDGVVSFIGLAGAWTGTGSITCSPVAACRIASHLLMAEYASVNEDVLDAVAELTNMIIGNVKTDLERHLGSLGLSIPTVVFGRNFRSKSGGAEWIVQPFHWEGEQLLIRLALAKVQKPSGATTPRANACVEL
ncbi:MAG: chemotaxis protein CheX [Acidobacteriia bacterium]|nr:chemotaxis protein CheX [Terriglobia bacterium]